MNSMRIYIAFQSISAKTYIQEIQVFQTALHNVRVLYKVLFYRKLLLVCTQNYTA